MSPGQNAAEPSLTPSQFGSKAGIMKYCKTSHTQGQVVPSKWERMTDDTQEFHT